MIEESRPSSSELLDKLSISLSRDAAKVLSEFLTSFRSSHRGDIQGPIPQRVFSVIDEISDTFKDAFSDFSANYRVSLSLNYLDVNELGSLIYFISCRGEREIVLGENSTVPSYPVDSAFLDLNEAFIKAGGRDNSALRNKFEGLGKEEGL